MRLPLESLDGPYCRADLGAAGLHVVDAMLDANISEDGVKTSVINTLLSFHAPSLAPLCSVRASPRRSRWSLWKGLR